jgi:hypothetical protein
VDCPRSIPADMVSAREAMITKEQIAEHEYLTGRLRLKEQIEDILYDFDREWDPVRDTAERILAAVEASDWYARTKMR